MWDETLFSCFNDCSTQGTIPSRVKRCREIDNLSTIAREYVVNAFTANKWSGIIHQKGKIYTTLKYETGKAQKRENTLLPYIQD
jgi:hypothetical protein